MPYKKSTGEHKTWKEFFKEWREGMKNLTQLQQKQTIQFGQIITGIGIIWGIIFSISLAYYWMALILVGGMVVLAVQYLGNWQQKIFLKEFESQLKETKEETNGTSKLD